MMLSIISLEGLRRKKGFAVEPEYSRAVGRMDLRASNKTEIIGIEIETGKSDVAHNVRQDLLANCTKVIVVCTDDPACSAVTRKLKDADLLIPNYVQVVLRDSLDINSP